MKSIMINCVIPVIIGALAAVGLYFATMGTEIKVNVVPTYGNAIIQTIEWKTDIFGNRVELISVKNEKLNPYSD